CLPTRSTLFPYTTLFRSIVWELCTPESWSGSTTNKPGNTPRPPNQEVEKLALLPTEKRKPKQRLEDFSILLYGSPKIGKSTFCSQMDHPLFLATEPGLEALEVYEVKVPDWKTFLQACAEISQGNHPFKTIVIDTVDNLWKAC